MLANLAATRNKSIPIIPIRAITNPRTKLETAVATAPKAPGNTIVDGIPCIVISHTQPIEQRHCCIAAPDTKGIDHGYNSDWKSRHHLHQQAAGAEQRQQQNQLCKRSAPRPVCIGGKQGLSHTGAQACQSQQGANHAGRDTSAQQISSLQRRRFPRRPPSR